MCSGDGAGGVTNPVSRDDVITVSSTTAASSTIRRIAQRLARSGRLGLTSALAVTGR
jgi:hypothetical protein